MDTFIDALTQGIAIGAVYAVITLGLTIIHSMSGVLNFAHGHLVVLAMYLAVIANGWGLDPYVASVFVIPVMAVVGAALYLLVFRRLAGKHALTAIQATLGLVFLIEGVLLMTQGGQFKRIHTFIDGKTVSVGTVRFDGRDLVALVVALAVSAALFIVLDRTGYGRSVRAVVQNPRGAQLVGVNIHRIRVITFALGAALAGLAGVLLIPGHAVHPSIGLGYTVTAIMAFYLGGPGNLMGTFLGAILLGLAESIGTIYLPSSYGFILPYCLVAVVIVARPQGLFARAVTA